MSIERMRAREKDIAFKTFDLLSRTRVVQPAFQRVRPPQCRLALGFNTFSLRICSSLHSVVVWGVTKQEGRET